MWERGKICVQPDSLSIQTEAKELHPDYCSLARLPGLPGFAPDSCSIIISISAFYFFILIYFLWRSWQSTDFWWNIDPPKTPKNCHYLTCQNAPHGVSWGQFVQPVSIPRFICIICGKCMPNRSSRLTTFPSLLNFWPKTPQVPPPLCLEG